MIRSMAELLAALEVDDEGMLVDLVTDETDIEAALEHSDAEGLIIRIEHLGTHLLYPFGAEQFWEAIDDLERTVREMYAAEEDG